MKIYKGKIDITPKKLTKLAGFAHRTEKPIGVKNNLCLRGIILEESKKKTMIFSGDVLFWGETLVNSIRDDIIKKYKIKEENVVFSATHNHSGPMLSDDMLPELGEYNEEYASFLKEKVLYLIDLALKNPVDVYAELTEGDMCFGVNRRYKENDKVYMKPNYDGPIDNKCSVIKFYNKKSYEIESVLINYAVHANVTDDNYINTDYPGVVCNSLEEVYPNSIVLFLQGFSGNVKPKLIIGQEFFRGDFKTVQSFSEQVRNKLIKIINKKGIRFKIDINSHIITRNIPIDKSLQTKNKLFNEKNNKQFIKWLNFIKKNKKEQLKGVELSVQIIRLSSNIIMLFLNGEVVTEYSLYIRDKFPNIKFLISGYSNGMVGYIPTKEQILDGGYESEDFIYYFGLPGKYTEEVEKIVKNAMEDGIKEIIER